MLATTGIPIFSAFCRIQRTRLEEGGQNDDNVDTSPCACHIAMLSRPSDEFGGGVLLSEGFATLNPRLLYSLRFPVLRTM